jgi:plasmid maintenance system antidote protein VapI
MKKILISLSIILAMSLSANAQMWLNLKAGGGLALASGSDGAKGWNVNFVWSRIQTPINQKTYS